MRQFLLACIATLLTFPTWSPTINISTDGSCAWLYNHLWVHDRAALAHLIFPHGPLDFLQTPLPLGNNLEWGLVFNALLRLGFFWSGMLLVSHRRLPVRIIQGLLLLVFLKLNMMDVLLFATTAHLVFLSFQAKNHIVWRWLAGAAVMSVLGLYIKTVLGLPCFMLLGMAVWIHYFPSRQWGIIGAWAVATAAILAAGWWLFFQNFDGFGDMLQGTLWLSLGNSSAVCHYPDNNVWLLGGFAGIWLLWPWLHTDRRIWGLLMLPAFAFWKYGISREDIWHLDTTFRFFLWAFSALCIHSVSTRWWHLPLSVVAVTCFFLNLRHAEGWQPYQWQGAGLKNGLEWLLHFNEKKAALTAQGQANLQALVLPSEVRAIIGDRTVDVFPWHYTFAAANELQLSPRRIPQSYAAYHPWLDQLDAQFLASPDAPDFILFHLNPSSEGGQFNGLDDRYLLQDAPQTILQMVDRYRVRVRNEKFLLLEKTDNHHLGGRQYGDTWRPDRPMLHLPKASMVYLSAHFQKSPLGHLKSLLYKDDPLYVDLFFGAITRRIKIVPALATKSIWIGPWLEQQDSTETYRLPDSIRLVQALSPSWNGLPRLELRYYPVDSSSGWLPPPAKNGVPHVWQLEKHLPDTVPVEGFSAGWEQTITQAGPFELEASAEIKGEHNSRCYELVIAVQGAAGKTVHYAKSEYCPMGVGHQRWWPVGLRTRLPKNIPTPYTVKVYVWNLGSKAIEVQHLKGRLIPIL